MAEGEDKTGICLEAFDYTAKNILSISDYREQIDKQIRKVRALSPGNATLDWVQSEREAGAIYRNNPLSKINLKGISMKMFEKLAGFGIKTVNDLIALHDDEARISELMKSMNKSYGQKLKTLTAHCFDTAIRSNAPISIHHYRDANPYKRKFGDSWEDKITKTTALNKFVCGTKWVTHVVMESKKAYENTKHKDSWIFYHDALKLMTGKDCVAWTKEQYIDEEKTISYHSKWILPVMGLNDEYARFKGNPIGKSPEMMPLDNFLNNDRIFFPSSPPLPMD